MRTFLSRLGTFLAAVAVLLILTAVAEACPTCKSGIEENSVGGRKLIQGYFWSIIFMMATPFAIIGGFTGLMYHEVRKARRERDEDGGA
ncbi:MAG: hypothetical protein MI757_13510 [Pirellulales bacterium]|nr:hypothetical protein [Pirellulales bacterium]